MEIRENMNKHNSSSLAHEGNNAEGEDINNKAPDPPPPSIFPPTILGILLMVMFGFDEEHEKRFRPFLIQRNLPFTRMLLNLRCLATPIRLLHYLMGSEPQLALTYFLFCTIPMFGCRLLCRAEWVRHLGWGILALLNSRVASLALPLFGLGDLYSSKWISMLLPLDALVAPAFEHMPVTMVWSFHHVYWLVLYFRNGLVDLDDRYTIKLLLVGYIATLAVRVAGDIQDRRAFIKKVNAD